MPGLGWGRHHDVRLDQGPKFQPKIATRPVIQTDFVKLSDGALAEMIQNPNDPADLQFAVYKDKAVQYKDRVEDQNRIFVPLLRADDIVKRLYLPRGTMPIESLDRMLNQIRGLVHDCVDVSLENEILLAHFVLSSWFFDRLPIGPYVALVGRHGSGKTVLLRVLSLLCRHAFLVTDASPAACYEIYEKLTPTLLLDESFGSGTNRKLLNLLRASTTRGSVAFRNRRWVQAFGPKVFAFTELPNDSPLNSRCIIIPLMETSRTDLVDPSDERVLEFAESLQMALLRYRLENYDSLSLPKVDGDELLSAHTKDLYRALALPVGISAEKCSYLVLSFMVQRDIDRETLSTSSAAVLRALFVLIHLRRNAKKLPNKDITTFLHLNPSGLELSAHEVGRALTSLGFNRRTRTSQGYMMWLDLDTRERIHKLAAHYRVYMESDLSDDEPLVKRCELCERLIRAYFAPAESKQSAKITHNQE